MSQLKEGKYQTLLEMKKVPSHYCWVFLVHLGWILNEICFYDNSSFLDLFPCRKLQKLCHQIKTKTAEKNFVTVQQ